MSNVYKFPTNNDKTRPLTHDEMRANIEDYRIGYVDVVSEFLTEMLLLEISRAGFNIGEDDLNEMTLIVESLRSLMLKKSGCEHPLQDFSMELEEMFSEENEDENRDELEDN